MTRVVIDNGGTDWLTPLATLLAVIVGGLVNWTAQRRLADKRVERERQVAQAEAAADAAVDARIAEAEMRTAARLIQADLSVATGHLKAIVLTGEWATHLAGPTCKPGLGYLGRRASCSRAGRSSAT
jgi:hypothetical protein